MRLRNHQREAICKPFACSAADYPSARRAFTLIEVMLALTVSAIVLAAIGGVFFSAMRLRDRTSAMLDETVPLYQALAIIRRDFQGALPPSSSALVPIAGDFKTDPNNAGRIQFYTTSGTLNENDPWGDVQQVVYELRDSSDAQRRGKDLYRTVSRNVLSTSAEQPTSETPLLGNVQSLEFECYDGGNWLPSWDTSISETNLPVAVRVKVRLAGDNDANSSAQQPYEMVVPVLSQSRTNLPDTTASDTGSTGGTP